MEFLETEAPLRILNIGDIQLSRDDWRVFSAAWRIAMETLANVLEREMPGLITVNGDVAYGGHDEAYRSFAHLMDSFRIPWMPVMGNHDHMAGDEGDRRIADIYESAEFCLFRRGDTSLGWGNYGVTVTQGKKPIATILAVDSHDMVPLCNDMVYAPLTGKQLAWYEAEAALTECPKMLLTHIPPYCYRQAFREAFRDDLDPAAVTTAQADGPDVWKKPGCFGVRHENECTYPEEDGVLPVLERTGTKLVLAGHDHNNSYVVPFRGMRLAYGLKTGPGCYNEDALNGATVITVGENGFERIYHSFFTDFKK